MTGRIDGCCGYGDCIQRATAHGARNWNDGPRFGHDAQHPARGIGKEATGILAAGKRVKSGFAAVVVRRVGHATESRQSIRCGTADAGYEV